MSSSKCCCLVYTARTHAKTYIGATSHSLDVRTENLIARPVHWLKDQDLKSLVVEPLFVQRVNIETALALEAAFTALEWSLAPDRVRGGPFCYSRLTKVMRSELEVLGEALKGKRSLQDRCRIVLDQRALLQYSGPLARHLRNQCFKCGKLRAVCVCRGFHWADSGAQVKRDRSKEILERRRRRRRSKTAERRDRSKEVAARRGKDRSLESLGRDQSQSVRKRPSGVSGSSDTRSGAKRRGAKRARRADIKRV